MTIVDQIRERITAMGWSEASRRSGVDRTHLHRAFGNRPRKNVALSTIERILPTLGLKLTLTELEQ